jgi:hypothetical protein
MAITRYCPNFVKITDDFQVADNSAVNLLPLFAGKEFDLKKHGVEHLVREDMELTNKMIKDDVWKHANMLTKLMKGKYLFG